MNAFLLINRSADLDLNRKFIFQIFIGCLVGSAHKKLLINSSQCGFAAALNTLSAIYRENISL
jgi:hypothetical protein